MVSPTSTATQATSMTGLVDKHRETLEWLSCSVLWKRELGFFQKVLDNNAPKFSELEDKMRIDHFQNLLLYYNGEVVDALRKKLRNHEHKLAELVQHPLETQTEYFKEHLSLMDEAASFNKAYNQYKDEFLQFVERVM